MLFNNGLIFNYGVCACGSYFTFPIAFTGNYQTVGTLIGTAGAGTVCTYNYSSTQLKFYCTTFDGKQWTDSVRCISIGY